MDRLASNPSSSSGIFGMPQQENDNDTLSLVNRLKDREFRDYQNKAAFDDERSLRQESRMRMLFDPSKSMLPQGMDQNPVTQNILTPDQQIDAQHRMDQPKLDLAREEMGQKSRFGQQGLDIKAAQEKLNDTKNAQINEDRDSDRNRKIEEANNKIGLAQQALEDKNANFDDKLQANKDMSAAMEERHKLELENKQHEFNITSDAHKKHISELEAQAKERLKQGANSETTTEVNPDGSKKTVTTKKGDAAAMIQVLGKDGKTYTIPKDKMDDKDADGTPHWKQVGG